MNIFVGKVQHVTERRDKKSYRGTSKNENYEWPQYLREQLDSED